MSLSSVTSKIIYTGDGATLIFPYTFKVFAEGDLTVSDYNVATGSSTVLTLNTDYLVDGVGIDAGGNVTLSGSYTSLPTGSKLVIQREMDLTQEVDYVENDPFPAQTLENALDKITMITQQLQEQCDRAVKSDISTVSSGIVYVDKEASASSAVVSLAASVASNSSAVVSLSQAAIAVSSATVAVSKATACASSAVVSLDAAVLSSGYAGAIDFSKDTDPLLTSNSDVLVATQKAIKSYAASKVSPTFLGTVNTVTLISTLVSSTTSYVTGTANATTLVATLVTATTLRVSGTANATTLAATLVTATSVNVSGTMNATNVKGDGSLLTGLSAITQVNDTDTGTDFTQNGGETTFLSVAKTITSGKTVLLIATGYINNNNNFGCIHTIRLKNGSNVSQTAQLNLTTDVTAVKIGVWSCSAIVTGLSGSVTFSVTAQANDGATNVNIAYGNLEVIEF